jgi:hypothetical protein
MAMTKFETLFENGVAQQLSHLALKVLGVLRNAGRMTPHGVLVFESYRHCARVVGCSNSNIGKALDQLQAMRLLTYSTGERGKLTVTLL